MSYRKIDLKAAVEAARKHLLAIGDLTEERARNKTPQGLCNHLHLRYADGSRPRTKGEKNAALISWFYTKRLVVVKSGYHESRPAKPAVQDRQQQQSDRRLLETAAAEVSVRKRRTVSLYGKVNSDKFLESYEWRRVRMEALKKYGARCQCCGASPADGAVMNVDHIKPRKLFPQLALDVNNLQVLCHECNHGKGNWDMTDWRKAKHEDQIDVDCLKHLRSILKE